MSSKQLAKYVVALETQTAKYQKGLEDARRQLDRFQKKQSADLTKIAKQFGVLAAGAWLVFAQGDLERALVMAALGVFSLIGSRVVLAEEASR